MTERREGGSALILGCFALAHLLLLAVIYNFIIVTQYTGVQLFYSFASKFVSGLVPYRDFPLEYPPLALAFFTLPRLVGSTLAGYYTAYQVEVVLFDLTALVVLDAIARRRGLSTWRVLAGYSIAVLAAGPIIGQQFDIFPAVLALLALACFDSARDGAGWALVALGTLTKLYPLLLAPVFLFVYGGSRPDVGAVRYALRAARTFTVTCLVVLLPLLIVAPTSLRSFFAYHARRGIQLESTYASGILVADHFGWGTAGTAMSFGAWNVTGATADAFAPASTFIFLAAMFATYYFLGTHASRESLGSSARVEWLATGALLVLVVALLTSKVLSPQYLIWLVPFLPLVGASYRSAIWAVFAAAGAVTYYIFPMHYRDLIASSMNAELALLVRNLLLVALAGLAAASLRRTALSNSNA
jgi:hypothetical protein